MEYFLYALIISVIDPYSFILPDGQGAQPSTDNVDQSKTSIAEQATGTETAPGQDITSEYIVTCSESTGYFNSDK